MLTCRRCLDSAFRDDWIISCVKPPRHGDGMVVRVFSLADGPTEGTLTMGVPVSRAFLVRLDEQDPQPLVLNGQTVRLTLGARKIVTLHFQP